MSDFLPLYYYLMDGLFIGFGIVTVWLLLPYRFFCKELQVHVHEFIKSITKIMPLVALIHIIVLLGYLIHDALTVDTVHGTLDRLLGPYGFLYVLQVIIFPSIAFLLWIPWVHKRRWMICIIAILIGLSYVVTNERFIIFLTTVHRDYIPDGRSDNNYDIFYFFGRFLLEQIIIFCVVVTPFHFFRIKRMTVVDD